MDTSSVLDAVRQHLGPDTIQQISSTLGTDPATTSNAVSAALPMLLGGLSHNASHPEGAAALDQALDAHDGSILDNLGSILGGAGAGGGIGGAILSHIFGAKRGPVEEGVGKASGLDPQQAARLLMMLAPIVMGVLGRMKQRGNVSASQLPDVLQKSTHEAQQTAPGGFDPGSIFGGTAGSIAKSVLGGILGTK